MKNYLKAEFDSISVNESLSRIITAGFLMPLDPTVEQMADIKTAVSEAVTNAIIHGYNNNSGKVVMELLLEENVFSVTISDNGEGIEDIVKAREPLFTTKPESDRSGMGFTVMESFMDSLHIESEKGKGTKVTMTKKL